MDLSINIKKKLEDGIKIFFYLFPFSFFLESFFFNLYFSIFIILSFILFYFNKTKIVFERVDLILLIFFSVFFLISIINFEKIGNLNLIKSFFLIRFFLFFIIIKNLFYQKIVSINLLSKSFTISIIAISLDIILQHVTGKNIFGFEPFDGRYNSFFEHEAIAGSYIQKFVPIVLFCFFSKKKNYFFIFIFLFLAGLSTILTLDRMPTIIYFLFLFLLIFFLNKKFFISFFLFIICFYVLITFYNPVKNRFSIFHKMIYDSSQEIFLKKETNKVDLNNNALKKKIWFENYFNIYYSVFLSQKNYFLGSGHKSFSINCFDVKNLTNNLFITCSTHPHNIYLEVFSSTGLFGFFIFIFFLLTLFINLIKNFDQNKNYSIFIIILILELIPFRSYGSIFTSINGTYFWFLLSLCNIKFNHHKLK